MPTNRESALVHGSIRPIRYDSKRTAEAEADGLCKDPSFGCLDNGYSFEKSELALKQNRFFVATAEFSVTRFVSSGRNQDPTVAQSAVHFIKTNYDLKICFWDLVNNPGLRDTLLDRIDASALSTGMIALPVESARGVEESSRQRSARKSLHDRIAASLGHYWRNATWKDEGSNYFLPFGKVIDSLPQGRNHSVTLHLIVFKRQVVVQIEAFDGYERKVKKWIQHRIATMNAMGLQPESTKNSNKQILGRFEGCGWSDQDEEQIAAMLAKVATLTKEPRQNKLPEVQLVRGRIV